MRLIRFVEILKSNAIRNCRQYSSIEIPKRVKRDNLSILKALSSVTKPDYSSPHYHFIDDPFLIPVSNIDKREFSASYVSGKNAARFVMGKYPALFQNSTAYPAIKDFMPPTAPALGLDSVDGLKERIAMRLPIESYDSYRKLFDEGIEIPREVLDDLFDLLCFTNHEALPQPKDLIEIHLQNELRRNEHFGDENSDMSNIDGNLCKKWKVSGPADSLFKDMDNPSPRNVCSYIKGMVKFSAYDLAYEQYLQELQKKTNFDVSTYNAVISCINHLGMDADESLDSAFDILKTMSLNKVAPNTKTFNEVLGIIAKNEYGLQSSRDLTKNTLAEMNKCGVEPSLTTWLNVLRTFYSNNHVKSNVLENILVILSETNIAVQEPTDLEFFVTAMELCHRNLRSLKLACMTNKIITDNGLENLLGHSSNVTSYYSNYLATVGRYDSFENFYSEYLRLTPHHYSPTYKVFDVMLNAIEDFASYECIPKIWSDMVALRFSKRPDLLEKILRVMSNVEEDAKLQQSLSKIVDDVLKQHIDSKTFGKAVELTGPMLSGMITVHLNSNNLDKCSGLMEAWQESELVNTSLPSEESLQRLCRAYIKKNDFEMTHRVLELIASYGYFSDEELLEEAFSAMTLTTEQKGSLKSLL